MFALGLKTIFIGQVVQRVFDTIGAYPAYGAFHRYGFVFGANVFYRSGFLA